MPDIRFGIISDAGSAYYFTGWGGAGFCNRMPDLNVKPAYVAMATLTQVLDGAKFERVLDLGSPSLYGLQFRRPDGSHLVAMWTPQGRRPVKLAFEGNGPFTFIDSQANETPLAVTNGAVEVTLTPSPAYLVTPAPFKSARPGAAQLRRQARRHVGRVEQPLQPGRLDRRLGLRGQWRSSKARTRC